MYVDEAGSGSQWINLDDLTVGDKGDGTLNVKAGDLLVILRCHLLAKPASARQRQYWRLECR